MKPMTTIRLRFIRKKTSNAQRPRPNVECRRYFPELEARRWALGGQRLLRSLECLHGSSWVSRHNGVRRNTFRYNGARRDDRVIADRYAFQDHRAHSDPDVVANFHRRCFQFWSWRPIFEIR